MSEILISGAFKNLGLNKKYPIFKKKMEACVNIFDDSTDVYSCYVDQYIDFINESKKSKLSGSSRDEKIHDLFSKVNPYFKYLYDTDPESLYATTFLINYLHTDLTNILKTFHFINLFKVDKKSVLLTHELIRITVNHLLILLAKCFCHLDMCEKISLKLFVNKNYALINDIDLNSIITEIFSKTIKKTEYKPWNKKMSDIAETQCASYLWETYYTNLHVFFHQKDIVKFINAHPELTSMFNYTSECNKLISGKLKTKLTKHVLVNSITYKMENFFYFLYLLERYMIRDVEIIFEPQITLDSNLSEPLSIEI